MGNEKYNGAWEEIGVRNHIRVLKWKEMGKFMGLESLESAIIDKLNIAPRSVTINGASLYAGGRIGWLIGLRIVQFMTLPPIMAPSERNSMG